MSGFFYLIFILFSVTVKFTLLKCTITKSVQSNVHSVQCMFAKNVMFLIFSHHIVAINHSFLFISSGIPWYEWTTVSFLIHLLLDSWAVSSLELLCIKITFWPHLAACGDLVPRPGIKPTPPALEAWSLNHWTTREVPFISFCPPPPKKMFPWTSLVVQWIRIHLPVQGTRVQSLVWEDSACQTATVA